MCRAAVNRYRVSAVSGDALGGWLEWFSALARQAQKFVLYDEDQVSMLREITDTVRVYDISIEVPLGTVDRIPRITSREGVRRVFRRQIGCIDMKDTLIVRDNVVVDVWDGGKHVKTYRSHNTWKPDGMRALRDWLGW